MDQQIEILFRKHLSGTLTPEESIEVRRLIAGGEYLHIWNAVIEADVKTVNELSLEAEMGPLEIKQLYQRIKRTAGITGNIDGSEQTSEAQRKLTSIKLWRQIAAVAAILVVVTMVWYFYNSSYQRFDAGSGHKTADILPGGNSATITLPDGKKIALSNVKTGVVVNVGGLRYSDGSKVQVSSRTEPFGPDEKSDQSLRGSSGDPSLYGYKEGRSSSSDIGKIRSSYVVLSTPKGGTYQVVLPDGTKVWLNAASSLAFPPGFAGVSSRRVELKGEAYFEVAKVMVGAKKMRMPFVVVSRGQEVEVLGTHFNINSYEDEGSIKTTLLEGAVRVTSLGNQGLSSKSYVGSSVLKPGQQAELTGNTIKLATADLEEVMSWKNGKFIFNDESLESIMRKVSRWYDVSVEYQGVSKQLLFGGLVSRSKNISSVLEVMESTGKVKFKISGRKIIVMN